MKQLLYGFITAHVLFRLLYVFYIGGVLRRQTGREKTRAQFDEWTSFKDRASLILQLDSQTFFAAVLASSGLLMSQSSLRSVLFQSSFLPASISNFYLILLGIVLIVFGGFVKWDAYRVIGEKGWYWYNFFCPPEETNYEEEGVYRYLENPMYGAGYLPLLGIALLFLSVEGLILAVFDWICIWVFYVLFERPHTRRHLTHQDES